MCLYGAYLGVGIFMDIIETENLGEAWFKDTNSGNRFRATPYSMGDDMFDQEDSPQLEFEFGNDDGEDTENNAHLLVDEVEQFLRDQGTN